MIPSADLIRYERPDVERAHVSAYTSVPVADGRAARTELGARHGVRGTVRKRRRQLLLGATRVHLDEVEGLGTFVELETVFEGMAEAAAREEHELALELLGLRPACATGGSYIDLDAGRHQ